ncbi:hypothetical protein CgunFtcFv8_027178 [Champsocephalus gunnari]|uniref:trypsin n=1 Tax=Champsocephalus gunnari TaxID=52237 RepID=A0AAN8DX84_CHAGU|nr:hypothetical protein CgunFtcFv8_027178 [Champsocephalus gunnari]
MFIHSELLILLALTLGGQVRTGKIIGGHKAAAHSRPYMVLLKTEMDDGTTKHCGGFLLNEDFVMTAAHCQARSYTVLLGVHNVKHNDEIQRINVDQTFPHKDYNATNYKNDIMLLKLSSKANFCENGDIGPGEGDSGGPLVCEDEKAYGVVSHKFKPDSGGQQIDCYAKITDYSRWIYLTMTKA